MFYIGTNMPFPPWRWEAMIVSMVCEWEPIRIWRFGSPSYNENIAQYFELFVEKPFGFDTFDYVLLIIRGQKSMLELAVAFFSCSELISLLWLEESFFMACKELWESTVHNTSKPYREE